MGVVTYGALGAVSGRAMGSFEGQLNGGAQARAAGVSQRSVRGLRAYHAGIAAEDQVARHYDRVGKSVCARRWRGRHGEIDIIARDGDTVVFIEVKQSGTHLQAAEHLSPRQMERICMAGLEFLEGEPRGQLTDVRIDVALVDGAGRLEILENAFAA
jgi:putative endonuclease